VAVRGNVLETSDRELLVSAYTLDDPNSAHLWTSLDRGVSWGYRARIAEGYNETYLYGTDGGGIVAFMRSWEGDHPEHLHQAHSSDGGATWSNPEPLCRGYPAAAVRLPSGRVLLTYGFRFDRRFGVRARLLSAECAAIPGEPEQVIRDDGAVPDLGYPHASVLPDGRAFVVYYTNRRTDAPDGTAPRYIEGCILAEE